MKRLVAATVVVLLGVGVAGPALGEPSFHTSAGVVADWSDSKVLVLTRVDLRGAPDHEFLIAKDTEVLGPDGRSIPITALQVGDYVREECLARPAGQPEVRRITLLTRAESGG